MVGKRKSSVEKTVSRKGGAPKRRGGNIYTAARDIITDIFETMNPATPQERRVVDLYKIVADTEFAKAYRSAKSELTALRKTAKS